MRTERLFPEIASLVRLASYQHAERDAFVAILPSGAHGQLSFLEVDEYSVAFGAYLLRSLGLRKGDRVAIHLPNCLAYPICALGILRAGLVLVNINPLYSERQLVEVLRDSGARVLVAPDFHAQKLERMLGVTAVRALITASVAEFFPFWSRALVGIGFRFRGNKNPQDKRVIKLQQALEFGMSHENWAHGVEVTPSPYDVAMFQYTGGTTGVSKAVMLTHSNIAVAVSQIVANLEHRVEPARDSILTTIPFSNSFAFVMNFLSFYWMGTKNILVPFSRPLHNLRGVLGEHRVSWMVGAPNFYRSLLNENWFSRQPPLSLKAALSVGMSLQRDIAEEFVYLTGAPLVEGYGLAEACSIVTLNSLRGASVFTNSVGVPLGDTELSIVDANGKTLGFGAVGELVVRGAQVMVGYWNRPNVTSHVLRDGWLFTGDLAQLLEDGSYRVMGRKTVEYSQYHENSVSEKLSEKKTPEYPEDTNPFVGV